MIHKHRNFITLHIIKFILMHSSGSKLNKITIMGLKIKIMMTSFMVIIIQYSIHVITIIIIYRNFVVIINCNLLINRRHAIIITNLHIKSWGTKNIIFIKYSIPKLMALHIISIKDIQRIHTNNIAIMLIIHGFCAKHFIEFFFYQLSTIFRSIIFKKDMIKMDNMRPPQFHFLFSFYKPN